MDINKILEGLRADREELERAIIALEGIGRRRRGRRPKWMKVMEKPTAKQKKKRPKD